MPIRTREQLHSARWLVQQWATRMDFSALERTKLVTAASELGRNTLVHGQGGSMTITELKEQARVGLQLNFEDSGPGIQDLEQALTDGFSTAKSLGHGLGGARRLVNEFEIQSQPGAGTRVTVRLWKRR